MTELLLIHLAAKGILDSQIANIFGGDVFHKTVTIIWTWDIGGIHGRKMKTFSVRSLISAYRFPLTKEFTQKSYFGLHYKPS